MSTPRYAPIGTANIPQRPFPGLAGHAALRDPNQFAEGQEAVCEKDGTPVSAALQRLDGRHAHLSDVLAELVTRLDNAGLLAAAEPTGDVKSLDQCAPPPWPLVVSIDCRASFAEFQANRVVDVLRRLAV